METLFQPEPSDGGMAAGTRRGSPLFGRRCSSCGESGQIYRFTRPRSAADTANFVFLGLAGVIGARSNRRGWLLCASCGHLRRRRTSLWALGLFWLFVSAACAAAPFLWLLQRGSIDATMPPGEVLAHHPTAVLLAFACALCALGAGVAFMIRRARLSKRS